jgi:hypothetical protein
MVRLAPSRPCQDLSVRRWELWVTRHPDGSIVETFFPDDEVSGALYHGWAEEGGAELIWAVEAKGLNDAMRKMYEHLGRGEYQPALREDGTPFPEDENDDYRPLGSSETGSEHP